MTQVSSFLFIFFLMVLIFERTKSDEENNEEDFDSDFEQTEFYLPYSVTEDVDFSLSRPNLKGCYQWSTDDPDVVRLDTTFTNFELMCGNRLEFQVLPGGNKQVHDFVITGENVDAENSFDEEEVPPIVEYTVHIRPIARLQMFALNTVLSVKLPKPAPFGISGFDADNNEFDTLDGVQIAWFIGSNREIAQFEKGNLNGPTVNVVAVGSGNGVVIAVLNDPNYQNLDPAMMEFSVKAPLVIEPSDISLLLGGKIKVHLMEVTSGSGQLKRRLNDTNTGEYEDYFFEVKDPDIAVYEKATGEITALKYGETTLFVKSKEGEIVKGQPLWVEPPKSLEIKAHPYPESKQLILGQEYTITIDIRGANNKLIHPSENILCRTAIAKELEIAAISENGLTAKIVPTSVGTFEVRASLRSVLTDDDDEIEILPHTKAASIFEVYEEIVIKPIESFWPWDENLKLSYEIPFKASGGGSVYSYSVSDQDLALVDSEGKVTTLGGPGSFKIRAFMPKSPHNYREAQVHILPPVSIGFTPVTNEIIVGHDNFIGIQMTALLSETETEVIFSDCADIPFTIKVSNEENFVLVSRQERRDRKIFGTCSGFTLLAKTAGQSCKVSLEYYEPSTGRILRAEKTFYSYNQLQVLQSPVRNYGNTNRKSSDLHLVVGSQAKVVCRGGPQPKDSSLSAHYNKVDVSSLEVIRVERSMEQSGWKVEEKPYDDLHVYKVTCLTVGKSKMIIEIGNKKNEDNPFQQLNSVEVLVNCALPSKILITPQRNADNTLEVKSRKLIVDFNKDIHVLVTIKDKDGNTFDNVESLNFRVWVSDETLLSPKIRDGPLLAVETPFESTTIPGKPYTILTGHGKLGEVEVELKLGDYNKEVLEKNKVENLPELPKVISDEEYDYEDEEEYESHYHSLEDSIQIRLVSSQELERIRAGI